MCEQQRNIIQQRFPGSTPVDAVNNHLVPLLFNHLLYAPVGEKPQVSVIHYTVFPVLKILFGRIGTNALWYLMLGIELITTPPMLFSSGIS